MTDSHSRQKRNRRVPAYIDSGDGPGQMGTVSEDIVLSPMIDLASAGHWKIALSLLHQFAREGASSNPMLITYIAQRIEEWLATDCAKGNAQLAFRVKKPEHREPSSEIEEKHVRAIETYLMSRGNSLTREDALRAAANTVSLAVKTIKPLVEGLHRSKPEFTPLQVRAIHHIAWEPLFPGYSGPARDLDFLKRCLGRGWDKWEAYLRARHELLANVRHR